MFDFSRACLLLFTLDTPSNVNALVHDILDVFDCILFVCHGQLHTNFPNPFLLECFDGLALGFIE